MIDIWKRLLTNNRRFLPGHPEYRRVFLLNAVLASLFGICITYSILNLVLGSLINAAIINAVSATATLVTIIYFHRTDNIKNGTIAAVMILFSTLVAFFSSVEHLNYSFIWVCVFPPVAYFLLGRRTGRIITCIYGGLMLAFILFNYKSWEPAEFTFNSILNLSGAVLGLVLMISYFEQSRKEAVMALEQRNKELTDSKDKLRLILDTTADAIYGTDTQGRCTFCNLSCLELLGYKTEQELLGCNMHEKIHHSKRDGSPIPAEECKILETVFNGVRAHSDDEVFWRADGSSFFVEYSSFPQYKDGEIIGCVISFEDITERKKTEERINYLRNHDTLTGLYNRSWLNEELIRINKQKNLPVSVVFGDVNGLKLTNDIFGHSAGDELLKKSADILKRVCGDLDTVARVGGDEFLILLPKTDSEKAEKIIAQIRTEFSKTQVAAIKCSISLGYDTKTEPEQDIERIMENAENKMYKEKTINRKSINTTMVNTIIASLHSRSLRERMHSLNVSELCEKIASAMELSETEVRRAKDAGFLHDIGKIVLPESLITQKPKLTAEEKRELQQHSVIGYRILNLFDNTLDLAEGVYSHHEAWNGSGYPKGIKEKEIPIISRIIAVAEAYDSFTNNTRGEPLSKQEALTKLRQRAGSKLDPRVVEALITIIGRESLPTDNKQEFSAK